MKPPTSHGGLREAVPFVSQNAALSLALDCFVSPVWKIWNCYNDGALERLNCVSVREALDKGLPGQVYFWFHSTPEVKAAIAAWDDQDAAFREGREVTIEASAEDAMRIARTFQKRTGEWRELWKKGEAFYGDFGAPVKVEITGRTNDGSPYEGTVTHPGFRLVSANASAETRKRAGL